MSFMSNPYIPFPSKKKKKKKKKGENYGSTPTQIILKHS